MTWSNWKAEDIGIKVNGAPAVASWKEGRLDVFVRSTDNKLYHRVYENDKWQGAKWDDLSDGHKIEVPPAAVSWGPGRVDLFAVWDKQVHHRSSQDGRWGAWAENLGGATTDGLAAASYKPNRVDVFLRNLPASAGTTSNMSNRHWEAGILHQNNDPWSEWKNLAGSLVSAPATTGSGPNRIDFFARGPWDQMIHTSYDGGTQAAWTEIDTTKLKDAPAAASAPTADNGRVDVFVRAPNDVMKHRVYYKDGWEKGSSWDDIGGKIFSSPAAVASWNANVIKRIDCFAQGDQNNLIHTWWK